MSEPDWKQKRCPHGWVDVSQCETCALLARVAELSRAYAVQGLAIEDLTSERDRYRVQHGYKAD